MLERVDEDALGPPRQQPFKTSLTQMQRQLPQIITTFNEESKAQSCTSSSCLPECSALKSEDAVHAQDDGLTVNDEPLLPVLQRRLDDPRIAPSPVIAAASDQPHAVAVALHPQPIDP